MPFQIIGSNVSDQPAFGIVAIGRNEGERLQRCLSSVPPGVTTIYVDSGSTDGSVAWARTQGLEVVELDARMPFTAARARNAGLQRLLQLSPQISYVQFVDGDCELTQGWVDQAARFLAAHSDVGGVAGRLRERRPDQSIYNWLCEREWDRPAGETKSCGGIAMMRVNALLQAKGFRDDLIAGEEPELCVRLRLAGWRIWRLQVDMALHDAAMTDFSQWWRGALRSGYADAQAAYLHGAAPERYRVWESRRAWFWGIWLPLLCLILGLAFGRLGWGLTLLYPAQVLRQIFRNAGPLGQRTKLAVFQMLARFAESWGQIKFMRDRLLGRQAYLIEYK